MTPGDLTEQVMRTLWPSFKRQLQGKLPAEEWELWANRMYFLKAIRASSVQIHLLATLPPNGQMISAALSRLEMMRELLSPSFNISLTTYPDEYAIGEAFRRYGINMAPKPWAKGRVSDRQSTQFLKLNKKDAR
jgi:hypothetical protein